MNDTPVEKPTFDLNPFIGELTSQFSGTVTDLADPEFLAFVSELAVHTADIGYLRAKGADPRLIETSERTIYARAQSIANTPALVVAANAPGFMDIARRFVQVGSSFLASAASYYIPRLIQPPA